MSISRSWWTRPLSLWAAGMLFYGLLAMVGPVWLHWQGQSEFAQYLELGATAPSWQHWAGTDYYGREQLLRLLLGVRISLLVGLSAALVGAVIGICLGSLAGVLGGRIDLMVMRLVDVIDALPFLFVVIVLATFFGHSFWLLLVVLASVGWITMARLVRGHLLALREQPFVLGVRLLGGSWWYIWWRHLLPNTLPVILVGFALSLPSLILQEAFLSFLGLGIQPPHPSLGGLISEGANLMSVYWWLLLSPVVALALLLLLLQGWSARLQQAISPHQQGHVG